MRSSPTGTIPATPIILTTHGISDIERLCQRVIIIDKGRLLYDGTLAEIKRRYGHLRVVFSLAEGARSDGLEAIIREIYQQGMER